MSITNKSLLTIIIIAISISVVGVVLSLGLLARWVEQPHSTGHATSGSAQVSVVVTEGLSITTADNSSIDFGGCVAMNRVVYSNESGGNNYTDCSSFTPSAIIIRNDGTIPANVTMVASDWGEAHGGTFINSTSDNSWVAYKMSNESSHVLYQGGCFGDIELDWTNISTANDYLACDYLLQGSPNNSISFDIAVFIPDTTGNGQNNISFTFWAGPAIR